MKLKKIMLMTAMAAAIGSVNMVSALADETATGETKFGWECDANNNWRYYNADGNLATGMTNMTKLFVMIDVILAVVLIVVDTIVIVRWRKKKKQAVNE